MTETPRADNSNLRHAISVLIAATAVFSNLGATARAAELDTVSLSEMKILVGLAYAQVMLAASYLAWSRLNIAMRAGVLAMVLAASTKVSADFGPFESRLYLAIHLCVAIGIALPLGILRVFGLRLLHPREAALDNRLGQFTLKQTLSLVAAVAILLGVGRLSLLPTGWFSDRDWMLPQSAVGASWLVTPLALKRWWLVGGVTCSGFLALVCWHHHLSDEPHALLAVTQWILVVGCCGLIRMGGYRLVWQSPFAAHGQVPSVPPRTTAHPGT